jgi:hypothetical protein
MTFMQDPCAASAARDAVPADASVVDPLETSRLACPEAFREDHLDLGGKNTFGLALVLGGTVSAGAYTAGVLVFWSKRSQATTMCLAASC